MSSHRRGGTQESSALSRRYTRMSWGDDIPATHVLFLPKDTNLGLAPFPVPGQSGTPGVVEEAEEESGVASSSQPISRDKPKLVDWRKRRSVASVKYAKSTAGVVRISDPKVGFGGRRSLALGSQQELKQGRKDSR